MMHMQKLISHPIFLSLFQESNNQIIKTCIVKCYSIHIANVLFIQTIKSVPPNYFPFLRMNLTKNYNPFLLPPIIINEMCSKMHIINVSI